MTTLYLQLDNYDHKMIHAASSMHGDRLETMDRSQSRPFILIPHPAQLAQSGLNIRHTPPGYDDHDENNTRKQQKQPEPFGSILLRSISPRRQEQQGTDKGVEKGQVLVDWAFVGCKEE